jgi:predicted DNA-binding transcriptional regulator AlpA
MISRPANAPTASNPRLEERYVNRKQLREIIPTSDMTLWRWQRDPKIAFPTPVKLGADGRNYWWLPKVNAWMREREKRRPPFQAGDETPGGARPGSQANVSSTSKEDTHQI